MRQQEAGTWKAKDEEADDDKPSWWVESGDDQPAWDVESFRKL